MIGKLIWRDNVLVTDKCIYVSLLTFKCLSGNITLEMIRALGIPNKNQHLTA